MELLLDTNVILRHLLQDIPAQGEAATRLFATAERLVLLDVVAAEAVYVLASFYRTPRTYIHQTLRALVEMPNVVSPGKPQLLRALDLYERERMDFADAYLLASAEARGEALVASFDKGLGKAGGAKRLDPLKFRG